MKMKFSTDPRNSDSSSDRLSLLYRLDNANYNKDYLGTTSLDYFVS